MSVKWNKENFLPVRRSLLRNLKPIPSKIFFWDSQSQFSAFISFVTWNQKIKNTENKIYSKNG